VKEETTMTTTPSTQRWIRIALVYFLIAVSLGLFMAASHDTRLRGLHVHLNLLGWVSLAITGLVYHVFPAAAETAAAKVHFWLYNLALPVMMASLAALLLGHTEVGPVLGASSAVLVASVAIFVVTVLRQGNAAAAPAATAGVGAGAFNPPRPAAARGRS
jgi:hypothetical protein